MSSRITLPFHEMPKRSSTTLVATRVSISPSSLFVAPHCDRTSQNNCHRVFLSAKRAWSDDCNACPCRLVSHEQFTSEFHSATETSSFQAAPPPDSLEATPTRRDFPCSAIAAPTSVRLAPTFVLCATSDLFVTDITVSASPRRP